MKNCSDPWQEKLPYAPLRAVWIIFSLFLVPGILFSFSIAQSQVPLYSVLIALPACISSPRQLGLRSVAARDFLAIILSYLVIIFALALTAVPWKLFLDHMAIEYAEQQMLMMVKNATRHEQIQLYFAICVITPIVEEVLFRRIIYGGWAQIHRPTALFGTSLLFSLAHFFLLGIPGLFIMGLVFQLIYLLRKNLLTAILLHGLVNTVALLANIFFPTLKLQ